MKPGIHPDYHPVVFQDSSAADAVLACSTITSAKTIERSDGSTYPLAAIDVSAWSHPCWTGAHRIVDTAGPVEKFHRGYGQRGGRK
ncbi:type B 50S ribosomal protein L31 [Amycolatopsis taiwanensis]|uniref:type B 50S ribosomal protein L31 n=1 Tax=Amycolatopsis taiwanensis TaxID=342230 RepID=UPI000487A2CD|nr:type B 50S ribosomal protein L31 [Amycolatopsis taiwanensis]